MACFFNSECTAAAVVAGAIKSALIYLFPNLKPDTGEQLPIKFDPCLTMIYDYTH